VKYATVPAPHVLAVDVTKEQDVRVHESGVVIVIKLETAAVIAYESVFELSCNQYVMSE